MSQDIRTSIRACTKARTSFEDFDTMLTIERRAGYSDNLLRIGLGDQEVYVERDNLLAALDDLKAEKMTPECIEEARILKDPNYVENRVAKATEAHLKCPNRKCGCMYHRGDDTAWGNFISPSEK